VALDFSDKQVRQAELVSRERICILVDRAKFETIPLSIRSYGIDAPEELLDALGFAFSCQDGPLYLFSSENSFVHGAAELKALPQNKGRTFCNVGVRPSRFFDRATRTQTQNICVDFGQPYSFTINCGDLNSIARISSIAAIALLEKIYIIQGRGGYVMPLEIDDKSYVVGFINPGDADDAVERMGAKELKLSAAPNHLRKLAQGLLQSEYAGLLLNPGTDAEFMLDHQDLEYLSLCVDVIRAGKPGTLEILRNLIGRK